MKRIVEKYVWPQRSIPGEADERARLARRDTEDALEDAADDRRTAPRLRTVYRVAKVARDKAIGLWRVRNISDRGMMLRTGVKVVSGERLSIALSDSVAMDGQVVWADGTHCGVEFDEPIDSAGVLMSLAAERDAPRYRAPRLPVSLPAVAYCEQGIHSVRITDVSQQGIGLAHDCCFEPGMRIMVVLEDGRERRGVVRWSKEGHAGLQLVEPIAAPELEEAPAL